jgi:hypothetical protein
MKSVSLVVIALAASFLLAAHLKAATGAGTKFDGTWSVTLDGKIYKNPDGSMAQPFIRTFPRPSRTGFSMGRSGLGENRIGSSLMGKSKGTVPPPFASTKSRESRNTTSRREERPLRARQPLLVWSQG